MDEVIIEKQEYLLFDKYKLNTNRNITRYEYISNVPLKVSKREPDMRVCKCGAHLITLAYIFDNNIFRSRTLTKEEFYAGGNSDPRNPNILKMFGFVNVGERAGSGVDKIMTAWAEQNWKKPEFDFSERSDRVTLKLEVGQVVYIPGAADIRNENTNQTEAIALSKEDKILEYIRQNGSISSQKAADIGGYKSKTGARKLLDKMIEKGLITKIGNGPATKYVI